MKKFSYCFTENPFSRIVMCLAFEHPRIFVGSSITLILIIQKTQEDKDLNVIYFSIYLRKIFPGLDVSYAFMLTPVYA